MPQKRGKLTGREIRTDGATLIRQIILALNKTYESTLFAVGDSPASLTFFTDQAYNSIQGWCICDGPGQIGVSFSRDGVTYGDEWTMRPGEMADLNGFDIHTLRITHRGVDSGYRVFLI